MRPNISTWLAGLTAAACLLAPSALASGSYIPSAPRSPAQEARAADREGYSLGKKVFNGDVPLTATADASAQRPRLERLQGLLPERTAKKKSLPGLAGKLSEQQLAGLETYVNSRFSR
ncbi:MAG: hypothetical protein ACKVYV_12665 [Limisphaerales bacterium]